MRDVSNRVYLYGLDREYRVVRYDYVYNDRLSTRELIFKALSLRSKFPDVESVYAVDNSYAVYTGCQDSMRTNSVEDKVLFKILLEADGIKVI